MFPIAWTIVASEKSVLWTWFVRLLKHDFQLGDSKEITIIYDMQKVSGDIKLLMNFLFIYYFNLFYSFI